MNGFTLFRIFDGASWTDAMMMTEMQGSAFYINCLYFLPLEFVHVLCQHFHCSNFLKVTRHHAAEPSCLVQHFTTTIPKSQLLLVNIYHCNYKSYKYFLWIQLNCIQSQQIIHSKADPVQTVKANTGLVDLNPLILKFSTTWWSVFDIKPQQQYPLNWSVCGCQASLNVHEKRKYLTLLGFRHQTAHQYSSHNQD